MSGMRDRGALEEVHWLLEEGSKSRMAGGPQEELSNTTHVGVQAAGQILNNEEGSRVMLNFCGMRAMGMK